MQEKEVFFYTSYCNLLVALESYEAMSDAELVGRVLNGNEHACRFLVAQYQKLVQHVVGRMVLQEEVVEDLCQDVFMKVFRRLHTFRGDARLSTWIATIAYNTTATYLKRNKGRKETSLDHGGVMALEDGDLPACNMADAGEVRRLLQASIEKLPVHYRTILTLFYLEEFSYREIGEITGMPEGTVKSYLHRSRQLLKSQLEKVLDHEGRTVISR